MRLTSSCERLPAWSRFSQSATTSAKHDRRRWRLAAVGSSPFGQLLARLAPRVAGFGQFQRRPRAKRQPPLLAVPAVEVDPRAAAAVGDAQREAGISGVEVVDLAGDGRLDTADCRGCEMPSRHVACLPQVTIGNKYG